MSFADLPSILREKCRLADGERIVLGLSGGPDSLALAHALNALGRPLILAHLDHALRPESAADARQVQTLAQEWGLPFVSRRAEAGALAQSAGMSVEEAARELRYRFLFELAEAEGAGAVMVAHNADDQAETVLMHLLRGAGLDGLSGMPFRRLPNPWSERIPLLRPLLDTWRAEIEAYCAEQGLQPLEDPSNQDRSYFRNRLRHDLLPTLADYNPQAKEHLQQMARVLEADRQLIAELAGAAWPRVLLESASAYLQFDRPGLLAQPLALQRQLLRRAFAALRPAGRDLGLEAVGQALDLAETEFSSPVDWLDGLYLLCEGQHFWIAGYEAELPAPWPQMSAERLPIEIPGQLELEGGWRLTAAWGGDLAAAENNRDSYQAWLEADALGEGLQLRHRRQGDRFQPLGLEGSLKLADYMINVKIPQRARAAWPLLCRGDEVLWLPGYQIAESAKLRPGSRRALRLRLERLD